MFTRPSTFDYFWLDLIGRHLAMDQYLLIPFTSYFGVHQGYRVLTHSHLFCRKPMKTPKLGRLHRSTAPGTEAEALQFGLLQLSRHRRSQQRKVQLIGHEMPMTGWISFGYVDMLESIVKFNSHMYYISVIIVNNYYHIVYIYIYISCMIF